MKKIIYLCIALLMIHFSTIPFTYEGTHYPNVLLQDFIQAKSGSTVDWLDEKWTVQEKTDSTTASLNEAEKALLPRTIILKPTSANHKTGLKITHNPAIKDISKSFEIQEIELPSTTFSYWMKAILLTTGVAALARYIYLNTYSR